MTDQEIDYQKNIRDKVTAQLSELGFTSNLQTLGSPWVGMNVFSLDPQTALVDHRQTKLIKELEKHKLTTLPFRLRHCYTHGGGIHCATLDAVRDSKLESYID